MDTMIGAERLCTKVHIRYTSALWMFGLLGMGCSDWVAKDTGAYDLLGLSTTSTSEPCIPQTECVDLQPVQAFNAWCSTARMRRMAQEEAGPLLREGSQHVR